MHEYMRCAGESSLVVRRARVVSWTGARGPQWAFPSRASLSQSSHRVGVVF